MNYPSIRIEGSILSPDIVDRLDDLHGQRPSDFGIESPGKVKDEIARAWADAQDYWRIYQRKLEALRPESIATTETRNLWIVPLLGLLGYQLEYQHQGIKLNDKNYPLSHRTLNRALAAVHITGSRDSAGLDRKPDRTAGPRMSAHAMVQEYLNLTDQLYAIVTNGRLLRLLRDSSRLVKLTYLEFDLDRIFTDGLFADFAVLYRLLHASRMPLTADSAAESLIERYHQDSIESGARIRDGLSRAVEDAILGFANGLLAHEANQRLCDAVQRGLLKPDAFYQNLLRLIYRLLFLLVIEERNLVYPLSPSAEKRDLYYRYYSLQRLRRLAEKRHLADPRHRDVWLAMLACFRLFEDGGPGPKLGIAPLAGDLFSPDAVGIIGDCQLDNHTVLRCLRSLSIYENPDTRQLIRVSYAALNVEEFGSVYEGLLEYEPDFQMDGSRIAFVFKQGDQRAATGSHYTPDDLVQPLLKHSLDHLIAEKLKEADKAKALLSLRVADIACGSGHILLAAARRIATELAIVRTGEEQPSPSAFRAAVRDVIRECIYGVDLNPLAVELCKVALWLEAHSPGEPLNFLDHHIKCGNAIVGYAHHEELDKGVPDEAFATMPGDDKAVAAALRKRNKQERKDKAQLKLDLAPAIRAQLDAILEKWKSLSALPERTPAEIDAKKQRFSTFATGDSAYLLNQIAAIPIAQFYLSKTPENAPKAITDEQFRGYWKGEQSPQGQGPAMAWAIANRKRFFHWFLEFPDIIAQGGFDCILGNPPYLGDKALSGQYGYAFCGYVRYMFAPAGLNDLVVYFFRRIFSLLRESGFASLITTNSIKDGDVRKGGLEQIAASGGEIVMASRAVKWPGRAKVIVSLLSIHNGAWNSTRFLDGNQVTHISSFLEPTTDIGEPTVLSESQKQVFTGYYWLGDGFLLTHEQADELIAHDARNAEVVFPVINGQELNNVPDQKPPRSIINFHDWSEARARTYTEPFSIIERLVKPFRAERNRARNRDVWWHYAENRPGLTRKLQSLQHCFVTANTTKYLSFSAIPTNWIASHPQNVFATNRWDLYAVVQSTLHEVWARKYSGALKQDLRYSPSKCFDTFPFPEGLWRVANPDLAALGERYHEHRRALMLHLWLGLTDIYNLFHDRDLTPEIVAMKSKKPDESEAGYQSILELRALHKQLDEAILAAYGWSNEVSLGHDFHEVETLPENDRVRYTISPAARKEILNRLLAENHARATAEAEARAITAAAKPKRGRKKATPPKVEAPTIFEQTFPTTAIEWETAAWLLAIVRAAPRRGLDYYITALAAAASPDLCEQILPANQRKRFKEMAARFTFAIQANGTALPLAAARRWAAALNALATSPDMSNAEPGTAYLRAMADSQMPTLADDLVALIVDVADRASDPSQAANDWWQVFSQRKQLVG